MINSKQRSKLRSLAHHIKPSVYIGKSGLTDGVYASNSPGVPVHGTSTTCANREKEVNVAIERIIFFNTFVIY